MLVNQASDSYPRTAKSNSLSLSASPFPPSARAPSPFLHRMAPSPSPSLPSSHSRPPVYMHASAAKCFPAPAPLTRLDRTPVVAAVNLGTSRIEPASSTNPPLPHVHQVGPRSHARSHAYPEIRLSRWDNIWGTKCSSSATRSRRRSPRGRSCLQERLPKY